MLQFVTGRDPLIIIIILCHIMRHCAVFDETSYLQVRASHYTLFALVPSCLDTAKATVVTGTGMDLALPMIVATPMNGTILSRRSHGILLHVFTTLCAPIAAIRAITLTLAHVVWSTIRTMLSKAIFFQPWRLLERERDHNSFTFGFGDHLKDGFDLTAPSHSKYAILLADFRLLRVHMYSGTLHNDWTFALRFSRIVLMALLLCLSRHWLSSNMNLLANILSTIPTVEISRLVLTALL